MTPETARKMTGVVILATIAILVVYDIVVELKFGYKATISQVIFDSIQRFPWMAFAAGFLCGHWIWR